MAEVSQRGLRSRGLRAAALSESGSNPQVESVPSLDAALQRYTTLRYARVRRLTLPVASSPFPKNSHC
jgi:hypothetical protein